MRAKRKTFSLRAFAVRIGWPHSYISDLVHGRKALTVGRALEFAQFNGMDSFETEHLIYFALKDSNQSEVQAYANDKLIQIASTDLALDTEPVETFDDLELLAVYDFLKWQRRILPSPKICEALYAFPALTPARVDAILEKLQAMKVISIRPEDSLLVLKETIFLDEPARPTSHEIHGRYALNLMNYCKQTKGPHRLNGAFVELPLERLPEIHDRLIAFRNWVLSIALETTTRPEKQTHENLLFQFDLNLFPIVDSRLKLE